MPKKPLFADGWYETPRTGELRQEIQRLYEKKEDWEDLEGVPTEFPPEAHTHVKADITDFAHTHTEADITDLTKGPVRVFRTSGTGSADAGKWTKVARVEIVNRFNDFNTTWLIQETEGSTGQARQGLVRFRVKQQNDFGGDPTLTLSLESFEAQTHEVGYVILQNTPTTIVEVYFKINATFTRISGFDLGTQRSPESTVTYFDSVGLFTSVSGLVLGEWSRFARFDLTDTLTGNFAGSLTGTASDNLPLTGGSLTGRLTVVADVTDQLVVRRSASGNRLELLGASGTTNEVFIRNALSDGTVDGSIIIDGANSRLVFRPGNTSGTRREVWHAGNLPYETGTWTPVIRGSGTAGTYTPTFAAGRCSYARIGNMMHVFMRLTGFSAASGGTNNLEIRGGPVNVPIGRIGIGTITIVNPVSGTNPIVGQVRRSNDATAEFRFFVSTDGTSVVPISQIQTTTTMDMALSFQME